MAEELNWRGATDMHPATFIQEEMDARNWTRDRMAAAMAMHGKDEPGVCRLKLDLYLDVGPGDDRLRLGETESEICQAFGLCPGFFGHMEASWLEAHGASSGGTGC